MIPRDKLKEIVRKGPKRTEVDLWVDGRRETVTVNRTLPQEHSHVKHFAELWLSYLEKALAQFCGGYQNMPATVSETLSMILGVQSFEITGDEKIEARLVEFSGQTITCEREGICF